MEDNKIILLGGNHHNGLNLVRNFGVNGLKPYGIIIGCKKSFVKKSRYWKSVWCVADEEEALNILLNNFGEEKLPPVVIPWSDGAAEMIDKNLDVLKQKYILPSLKGIEGNICQMMDKQKQLEFAKKYNLPMANTMIVNLNNPEIPDEFAEPYILKPVKSSEGSKMDIKKCDNKQIALEYMKILKDKGYSRILLQEFLEIDYEIAFNGACANDVSYVIFKKSRLWNGSMSYGQCELNERVHEVCKRISSALQAEDYRGLFDIELFYINDEIYLNEINWRNTGNSYIGTEVYYPVIWYYSMIGKDTLEWKHVCYDKNQYLMNEATDLRHVVFHKYSIKNWINDCRKVKNFALWFPKDLCPVIYQYGYLLKELILMGIRKKQNEKK